jgi:hypothetical protein
MRFRALTFALPALLAACLASPSPAAPPDSSDYAGSDLGASTAPAWVPPAAIPAAERWETVLRLPGRVLSLPFVVVGNASEGSLKYIENENVAYKGLAVIALEKKHGFAIVPAALGDRTGTGLEARWAPPVIGRRLLAEISASTRQYNRERVAFFFRAVRAVYLSEWRSRDPFFGAGMQTIHEDASAYAVRGEAARLILSLPSAGDRRGSMKVLEGRVLSPAADRDDPKQATFSAWAGPRYLRMTDGRDTRFPSIETKHPEFQSQLNRNIEHFVYGARLMREARYGRPHWIGGWRASVEAERFDKAIEPLALKDAHTDAQQFTRLTYALETGASFGRDPRTIRLYLTAVDQVLDDGDGVFLVQDFRSLGGANGLWGFEAGRWRDLDAMLGRLSYIYPLGKNLEMDLHLEEGAVMANLADAKDVRFRPSIGASLRFRGDYVMLGMIAIEASSEQTRFRFSIGGVE